VHRPHLPHRLHVAAGDPRTALRGRLTKFECEGLDKAALAQKLDAASFADLVAVVESLGF
jgi:hypothetical protein